MGKVRYSKVTLIEGKLVESNVQQLDPARCPHFILVGEHYCEDGSCKCDDPNAKEMIDWGYRWNCKSKRWV